MEQWEIQGPRNLQLRSLPDPEPGPDQVLVDVAITAVSPGTELFAYRAGPTSMMTAPGYLASGTVRTRGTGVAGIEVGERVVFSAPHGSVAVVDAASVTAIPDGVGFDVACLTHLAGLGHASLHAGEYRAGDDVAVVGAGLVGMCTALVAELVGARVHIVDVIAQRLELPGRLGLRAYDATLPDVAERLGADSPHGAAVVVDTSGSWSGLLTGVKLARKGTRICVLGVNRQLPTGEIASALFAELLTFPARFHYEGLRIIGGGGHPRTSTEPDGHVVHSPTPQQSPDFWTLSRCRAYLLEAIAQRRLDLSPLITDVVDPRQLSDVMRAMDDGDSRPLGVLLDWRQT